MLAYVARRVGHALLVLVGVSIIVFVLARLSGDPVQLLLPDSATQAEVEALRDRLGLNQSIPVQYFKFLTGAVQGDFGDSIRYRESALGLVLQRFPATALLAGASMLLALVFAIPAGVLAATHRGGAIDRFLMGASLFGHAIPVFWLAIMMIMLFAVRLQWFPATGSMTLQGLVLPAVTLGLYSMATLARLLRRGLVDVMNRDYIRTAHAKGLSNRSVLRRHAMRNALIPVVTVFGLQLGGLLSGAVITEIVFAYPGMGRLAVQAIYGRDFPVVQAFVIVGSLTYVVMNLLVDILYSYLDPRIQYS